MRTRMNERIAVVPNVFDFPHEESSSLEEGEKPTWLQRRAYDAYITDMAANTTPPRTPINWTVVTGLTTVCGFILILLSMLCTAAWFMSAQYYQIQTLQNEMKDVKSIQQQEHDIKIANGGVTPDPEPTPAPKSHTKEKH